MKVRIPDNGMGNMQSMLKQAQQMQADMEAKRAELDAAEYEISAGGGVVHVKINGKRQILALEIEPELVDPDDVETLQDIVMAAINEAIRKVDETEAQEMAKITGPMSAMGGFGGGLPGLF
ncbi:MAG: YbaB/EbfC family nucleoid-associated protein [Clostridia bacterium]|nr:YbaB/EbfC family nucleoid-associated protein [Clostridia bacterium]